MVIWPALQARAFALVIIFNCGMVVVVVVVVVRHTQKILPIVLAAAGARACCLWKFWICNTTVGNLFLTSRKWTQIAKNHHRHRGPKFFAGGSPCTFGIWGPHLRATHLACTTRASTLSGHPGPVPPVPPFTAVLSVFYYPPDDFPGPQVRYLFAKSIAIKGIDGVRVQFWVRVATRPVYAPPGTFRTCPGGGGGYMGGFRGGGGGGSFTAAPSNPFALPKFWTLCILLQVVWAWDVCCCVLVVFGWVVCSPVGFWVVAVPSYYF